VTRTSFHMPFGAELRAEGVAFRLWAPAQATAHVVVDGVERPLERREDGWFERVVAEAHAGSRYAFGFPGSDVRVPDPASRFQPDGAHGASVVVDPNAYAWRETAWRGRPWHEAVVYELHVGTFTPEGTYAAAAARLGELAELGVTAVELMPVAQPAGERNWGYDGVLPFAPQRTYGPPDELKAFVDAAHARSLSVLLDVVYNHFGPEGNYLHLFAGDFFTERHHTPWGAAINVDGERADTVREFFIQNALYWLREYRFDGLRFDAVHEIRDDSSRPFLDELAARVRAAVEPDRHVHLVLENDANVAGLLDRYDAQWNDDAHHAFHVLTTGERDGYYRDYADAPAKHLARALAEGFAYQGEPSPHRGGAPRGEPSAGLSTTAFVDFLQNHDQIGNRAFGERISALAPRAALDAATAVLLLAPAIPLLFMGEEWAASTPFLFFSDFGPELAAAVTEGRRKEFAAWAAFSDPATRERIPDPQDPATMRASTLRWDERGEPPHAHALALHRELLALRASAIVPHLAGGAHGEGWETFGDTAFAVRWRFGDGVRLALIANLGAERVRADYAVDGERIFALGDLPQRGGVLPPWSVGWFLAAAS
jgi:maltooligosyltrehalose trehalohydrolase